jgi:DNA-binding NtrC family response regulator
VLVASHKNLSEEVKKGTFREDLYYRLLGLPIHLPPLRERGHDVILLAKYMLNQFCQENEMTTMTIDRAAQEKILRYPFPGNVRELKSVIELAAVMSNTDEIQAEDVRFNAPVNEDNLSHDELTLKDYNLRIIRNMLEKYNNNVLKVAKKLEIGKSTIYRYLKEIEKMPD